MAQNTPATPSTVLPPEEIKPVQNQQNPVNPVNQTDSFGMSQDFIATQQAKRATGEFKPATVSATATKNEVMTPAPVIETAPQNTPATPSTVAPPQQVEVKQEKPVVVDNKALQFNKAVDENRKKGMNEQDAYQTAYRTLIKPTVTDLRKNVPDTGKLPTQDERKAQFQNNTLKKYGTMTSEQLFNELKNGNITPSLKTELQTSPAYQEASKKFDSYKQTENINSNTAALLGKNVEKDPLMELSNNLTRIFTQGTQGESQVGAFREYLSQNPTITSKTADYNTQMAQKKELERARESIVKDLKAKYAGQPLSTILAMAARDSEPLNTQINSLNDSLTILGAEIKQETDFATQEFSLLREEQAAQQAKQQKLQEVLANLAISDYTTGQQRTFEAQKMQAQQAYDLQKIDIQNKFQTDRDVNNFVQDLQKLGIQNEFELQRALQGQGFQKELLSLNQKYENSRSVRDFQNDLTKLGYQFNLSQQSKALDLANEKDMEDYKASLNPDLAAKWEAVREKATEKSSLADLYGKNVGTYEGNRGYDLAGKLGDAIVAPPGAKVISINSIEGDGTVSVFEEGKGAMSKKDPGWGNSVLLQLPDGSKMRLSHLQDISVNLGETLAGGQALGTRGNTGNVLGKNGEKLTPEQLAAGRGAHVDVEIFDPNGKLLSQSQQLEYLKNVKPFQKATTDTGYSLSDVERFNNSTFKPQSDLKTTEEKARYEKFVQDRTALKQDKNAKIEDIINMSSGGRELAQGQEEQLSKFSRALSQLGDIQSQIEKTDTGPILGRLSKMNPYDTDAQVLKAQLQGLIPTIARGVYGEVGVLTDQDIENYAKTIPNLTSTNDVNDAVLAMTLDILAGGYKDQLATYAAAGRDVSGFAGIYQNLKGQAESLKQKIGIGNVTQQQQYDYADAYLKQLGY